MTKEEFKEVYNINLDRDDIVHQIYMCIDRAEDDLAIDILNQHANQLVNDELEMRRDEWDKELAKIEENTKQRVVEELDIIATELEANDYDGLAENIRFRIKELEQDD